MPDSKIRQSFLAGSWYPQNAGAVRHSIQSWSDYLPDMPAPPGRALGVVAPHAGWHFSGRLASKTLELAAKTFGAGGPELVAVLGGHLGRDDRILGFEETRWSTPLGDMVLAPGHNKLLAGPPFSMRIWAGRTDDNTVEILLPLVGHHFPKTPVWALRVPPNQSALDLGTLLAKYMGGRAERDDRDVPALPSLPQRTLLVASTDLTHFGARYRLAPVPPGEQGERFRRENDLTFINPAMDLNPGAMIEAGNRNLAACSAGAAAAVAQAAKMLGGGSLLVDHYSSYDVMPDEQSVGYAGLVYYLPDRA
ncbi:MAG: AmmeMemoRadiSam system protein B [Deltaproteobacteria bacterium]|jgi:AmmeMemoRadiSam system protein B|nr:AmmeMemoRadiSam system protein B [Deltaproteobacteria bacterium]